MKEPKSVPLKKIVKRHKKRRSNSEYIRVDLECGHFSRIAVGSYPKRTRCHSCFVESRRAWVASTSCKHGAIIDETDPKFCKDCYIEKLETDIQHCQKRLQAALDSAG